MTAPTVPNWITNAVVIDRNDRVYPVAHWRATRTQVVVQTKSGTEHRYRLTDLREVGVDRHPRTNLAAADDPRVSNRVRARVLNQACGEVLLAVNEARLQDSVGAGALDLVMTKLETIRQAVVKAQASLADL